MSSASLAAYTPIYAPMNDVLFFKTIYSRKHPDWEKSDKPSKHLKSYNVTNRRIPKHDSKMKCK